MEKMFQELYLFCNVVIVAINNNNIIYTILVGKTCSNNYTKHEEQCVIRIF